ncbi:uncharacterized protein FTJAE_7216 [Fusarium tjaetaba]|uniref:3'-5' exonuclease domain-containing protein n=1 Tax=Fusarium tjaetaba TaxID=1567544 RepID=A0A8H5VU12_9HYPO|nr:uncharacterized protein FTJAE_7216 [Fusarium tjaetaba]KAF5633319.1 hypothetical protein FTJAE_7216 [Fusarium tjaetaba]
MDPQTERDIIPTYESEPRIIWIDNCDTLYNLLYDLDNIPKISILQIYNAVSHRVYLIDVYWLGATTSWRVNSRMTTLKGILESKDIIKVFFDVKKNSDALYSEFKIKLAGVHDLQLMELLASGSPHRLRDIEDCFWRDVSGQQQTEWRLWDLRGVVPSWCSHRIRDRWVQILPTLYACYDAKLLPGKRASMIATSNSKVEFSRYMIRDMEERRRAFMCRGVE